MAIADEQYVLLTVADATTRARLVSLSDGRLGLWPAADIAADIAADGQTVTLRAERPESPAVGGTAQLVRSGRAFTETRAKLRRKYGWRGRLAGTAAVVVVVLE